MLNVQTLSFNIDRLDLCALKLHNHGDVDTV